MKRLDKNQVPHAVILDIDFCRVVCYNKIVHDITGICQNGMGNRCFALDKKRVIW